MAFLSRESFLVKCLTQLGEASMVGKTSFSISAAMLLY
jgi:hypothetical protein